MKLEIGDLVEVVEGTAEGHIGYIIDTDSSDFFEGEMYKVQLEHMELWYEHDEIEGI